MVQMEAVNYAFDIVEEKTTDNGFVKHGFRYQLHDRIQWGNMLCIVLAGVLTGILRQQFGWNGTVSVICLTVSAVLLLAGFSLMQGWEIFRAVGYCWRDGDVTVIECGGQECRIASVKELTGGDTRFFFAGCSVFSIVTDRDVFEIYSLPLKAAEQFEDSSVYPLFQMVLDGYPYLESVELPGQKTKYRYVRIDK